MMEQKLDQLNMGEMNKAMDQPDVAIEMPEEMASEEPTEKPDILRLVQTRYASSFTMHALNHIQDGKLLEKIVWIVKLFGLFAAAVYICWGLFTGYLNHDVNTTIKTMMKTSLKFPKMYLCTNHRDQMAGRMHSPTYKGEVGPPPSKSSGPMGPPAPQLPPGTQLIPLGNCGGDFPCTKSSNFGHCVVINDNGNLEQLAGKFTNFPGIWAYRSTIVIDQPLEVWISTGEWKWGQDVHKEVIPRAGIYSFKLSKTIYHRLPAPYTDCVVDGSERDITLSMFSGPYSFEKCASTCRIRAELELCGFIRNENTIYMRNEKYKAYVIDERNLEAPQINAGNCSWSFVLGEKMTQRIDACMAKCPEPCEEIKYDVSTSYYAGEKNRRGETYEDQNVLTLRLEFEHFIVTEIGQQPAYELTSLVANFGGTLGLMCGMSAVSILELLIWMFLGSAVLVFGAYKKLNH